MKSVPEQTDYGHRECPQCSTCRCRQQCQQQDAVQQSLSISLTFTGTSGCRRTKETEACLSGLEDDALLLLQAQHILHQEAVCIVPRQEDVLHNCEDALLLEAQSLPSHHGGVDQVETQCISAILVQ